MSNPEFSATDHRHMAHALQLAELGRYSTRPNPRVGCVIAHGEGCVGRGWHQRAGSAHAEVYALAEAGEAARGATAYVTLEPCAHTGRTAPCADALIAAGISRVIAACVDPFPQVAGRGLQRLRAASIDASSGLMEAQARALNAGFLSRIERGRPWLRLKLASSIDGRIALASGKSQWLTGAAARNDGHRFRSEACAILSGIGTVLADDPSLDARWQAPEPSPLFATNPALKVIVDRQLRLPSDAKLLRSPGTVLLAHAPDAAPERLRELASLGADLFELPSDAISQLPALMQHLAARGINQVHSEAGAKLSGALISGGLVDELLLYQAPVLLGDQGRAMLALPQFEELAQAPRLQLLEPVLLGADLRLRFTAQV